MASSKLWIRVLTALLALAVVDVSYGRRVRKTFIPERSLVAAVAAGQGCVATFGDSRMVAGLVSEVLLERLQRDDPAACHAQLAIGAGDIAAHHVALRRYLVEYARRPRLLLLGVTLDSILARPEPPERLIGNQVVVLGWSEPGDVALLYPGFPWHHFDDGFRFLVQRSRPLLSYGSLTWAHVQRFQDRLIGKPASSERNRFGLVADMRALAEGMRTEMAQQLGGFPDRVPFHPAFLAWLALAKEHGVESLVVELPMPADYRNAQNQAPNAGVVRAAMCREVERHGGRCANSAAPSWIDDRFFADDLHLDAQGAKLFSRDVAEVTARVLEGK